MSIDFYIYLVVAAQLPNELSNLLSGEHVVLIVVALSKQDLKNDLQFFFTLTVVVKLLDDLSGVLTVQLGHVVLASADVLLSKRLDDLSALTLHIHFLVADFLPQPLEGYLSGNFALPRLDEGLGKPEFLDADGQEEREAK